MQAYLGFDLEPGDLDILYTSTSPNLTDVAERVMKRAVTAVKGGTFKEECNATPLALDSTVGSYSGNTPVDPKGMAEAGRFAQFGNVIRRGVEASNLNLALLESLTPATNLTPELIESGEVLAHRWGVKSLGVGLGKERVVVSVREGHPYGDGAWNGFRNVTRAVQLERITSGRRRALYDRASVGALDFDFNHQLIGGEWSVIGLMVSRSVRGITNVAEDEPLYYPNFIDETQIMAHYVQSGAYGRAVDSSRATGIAFSYTGSPEAGCAERHGYTSEIAHNLDKGPWRTDMISVRRGLLAFRAQNPQPIVVPQPQLVSA